MRYLLLIITLFTFSLTVFSQQEKVSKVRINLGDNTIADLANIGIPVDHGEYKIGHYIISEFKESEINQVIDRGFKVDILVDDVTAKFLERNSTLENGFSFQSSCNNAELIDVEHFEYGSMGGFLTYEEILQNLDSMHILYPELISERAPISTFKTHEDRPIYWLRISNNPTIDQDKKEILYDALHHAREAITVSQTIFYMWYLLENYESDPIVKDIIDNLELYFIPCVNPDGYIYNETTNPNGGGFWRKNRRVNPNSFGVDLNRNYSYGWGGSGSSGDENSNTYRGPAPFSEPETQAMKWFTEQHQFEIALNYHSYSNLLLHPWGYISDACPDDMLFRDMKAYLTEENGYANITGSELYLASGVSDDWMYGDETTTNKILAMTPEVGGSQDGFWPTLDRILPLCSENIHANLGVALVLLDYAEITDRNTPVIPRTGSFEFSLKRLGLEATPYEVSIEFVEGGTPSSPKNYAAIEYGEFIDDAFDYDFSGSTISEATFKITVSSGNYSYDHFFIKTIGDVETIFTDTEVDLSAWATTSWEKTTAEFYSSPSSTTDSPDEDYSNNANTSITLAESINLSGASNAFVELWAKWEIEDGYDYAQIQASVQESNTWTPLCGQYTSTGNNNQDEGQPLYDGLQSDWVLETLDLSDYLGEEILIRVVLVSDNGLTMDGFYFDDFKVDIVQTDTELPVANCVTNIDVFLNTNGIASIEADQINNGSTDNNIIASLELDKEQFTCNNIGDNTVTLTVTDISNNEATCLATVTVIDSIPPLLVCKDLVLNSTDASVNQISPSDIVELVSDNCEIQLVSLSKDEFTNADIGDNMVIVTAEDINGLTSTCTANVQINILTSSIDNEIASLVSVHPNPFKTQTVLDFNETINYKYDAVILDVKGSEVRRYKDVTASSLAIKKGNLNPGIYFLSIYKGDENLGTYKLVVD